MTPVSGRYPQLGAALDQMEQDARLDVTENFVARVEAIDLLEFHLFGALDLTSSPESPDAEKSDLARRAEVLKRRLDDANNRLFGDLRAGIRAGDFAAVRQVFQAAARQLPEADDGLGYDALDMLVNGLLEIDVVPEAAAELETDLIFYQPTPARIVLKLVEVLQPAVDDVLYDLGSGLGHVPILVNLLTGIQTRGIELDENYCRYADACVQALALTGVTFVQADARQADFSEGTIFYLYTPFQGQVLRQVLGRLANEAERRAIRIGTYGPCTIPVARQPWLKPIFRTGQRESSLGIFDSVR